MGQLFPIGKRITRTTRTGLIGLVGFTLNDSLSVERQDLSATTVGDYALFGGGYTYDDYIATVDAYDSSLTRSTPTPLSVRRRSLSATTVGDYALFGGGDTNYGSSATVDGYIVI